MRDVRERSGSKPPTRWRRRRLLPAAAAGSCAARPVLRAVTTAATVRAKLPRRRGRNRGCRGVNDDGEKFVSRRYGKKKKKNAYRNPVNGYDKNARARVYVTIYLITERILSANRCARVCYLGLRDLLRPSTSGNGGDDTQH